MLELARREFSLHSFSKQTGLLLATVLLAIGCSPKEKIQNLKDPHIVLISIDTLRADHLASQGYHRTTAPNIDKLAQRGIRFSNAISQSPWTLPSMASLHSSLYPSEHGAILNNIPMDNRTSTIAETLKKIGYGTTGIVSHVFLSRKYGFSKGFDTFDQSLSWGHDGVTSKQLTELAVTCFKKKKTNRFSSGFTTSIPITPMLDILNSVSPLLTGVASEI